MDGFLKIVGAALFWLPPFAVVGLAAYSGTGSVLALLYALPFMVSGAATYALGAILTNLIAIRESADRQAAALDQIANGRP